MASKLTAVIFVRLTEPERKLVAKAAADDGRSVSAWTRRLIVEQATPKSIYLYPPISLRQEPPEQPVPDPCLPEQAGDEGQHADDERAAPLGPRHAGLDRMKIGDLMLEAARLLVSARSVEGVERARVQVTHEGQEYELVIGNPDWTKARTPGELHAALTHPKSEE